MISSKILREKSNPRRRFHIFKNFQTDFIFLRHKFHKLVFSKVIWHLCSSKICQNILNLIGSFLPLVKTHHRIIDVSCGYDDLQSIIAHKFKNSIVIGNDLNSKCFDLVKQRGQNKNLIHTNHNLFSKELYLNGKFDVLICKNTIHHIPKEKHFDLIEALCKIGDNLILVDIENPLNSSLRAFIWNFYYRKFLKDDGINFISKLEFKNLLRMLKRKNSIAKIYAGRRRTIKGTFMFGLITTIKDEKIAIEIR